MSDYKQTRFWHQIARLGLPLSLAFYLTPQFVTAQTTPPFGSTADTVFDIIQTQDASTFRCLSYEGRTVRQMWDKRVDAEFDFEVFLFQAHFDDGPPIDIILNPEFETIDNARAEALRYTHALGQLPPVLRQGIRQFGIHKGMPTYSAGTGKIFVYSDRTTVRISENHLEESLLHEAVHASLDHKYRLSPEWVAAQQSDPGFVTQYAASRPEREDLAETALFAFGFMHHPERVPPVDTGDIRRQVPARLVLLEQILSQPIVLPDPPDPPAQCR